MQYLNRVTVVVVLCTLMSCGVWAQKNLCSYDPDSRCYDETCGIQLDHPRAIEACECVAADIASYFTECDSETKTRNLIYYWRPPSTCIGAMRLPSPVYGLPCNLDCDGGMYFDVEQRKCKRCPMGQFNTGEGALLFDYFDSIPAQFTTYCAARGDCAEWRPLLEDGIDSGDNLNNHYISTVLSFRVIIRREGAALSFVYKVSSQMGHDLFSFAMDDLIYLRMGGDIDWRTFTLPVPPGSHTFEWRYFKDDDGESAGEDRVLLKEIKINGTRVADSECELCPPGFYQDKTGQTTCKECLGDSPIYGASRCVGCSNGTVAIPGSDQCHPIHECDEKDIVSYSTPCIKGTRNYITMLLTGADSYCDASDLHGIPASSPFDCVLTCLPGQVVNEVTSACEYCEPGHIPRKGKCCLCPDDQAPDDRVNVIEFFDPETGFDSVGMSSGCTGDNCRGRWRLRGNSIDSGTVVPGGATNWVKKDVEITSVSGGSVSFDYLLSCDSATASFLFYVDGNVKINEKCDGCNKLAFEYDSSNNTAFKHVSIPLTKGKHELKWSYMKLFGDASLICDQTVVGRIVINGGEEGGSSACGACPPNQRVNGHECEVCPAGTDRAAGVDDCKRCHHNWFSTGVGASCQRCGNGTSSSPGSSSCQYECGALPLSRVSDTKEEIVNYDLSPLLSEEHREGVFTTTPSEVNDTYTVSLCEPVPCMSGDADSFVCRKNNVTGLVEDLGGLINFMDSESGLDIVYKGARCVSVLHLVCDVEIDSSESHLSLVSANERMCEYHFSMPSKHGCRRCEKPDFMVVESTCSNGKQTITYVLKAGTMCSGDQISQEETACSDVAFTRTTVLYIGGSFFSIVIMAALVLLILSVKHKRLVTQYELLTQDEEHGGIELPVRFDDEVAMELGLTQPELDLDEGPETDDDDSLEDVDASD